VNYEKFDPQLCARLALNYLTGMVDAEHDYLPYWLIAINASPAYAEHCRVDDAELVASWYDAIARTRLILDTEEGAEVQAGFKRHMFSHWGEDGLRYHAEYPWTHTVHHAFHEDAYLLTGLNTAIELEEDGRAAELAAGLMRGLRKLVLERRTRTFWSGDYPIEEPVYEFPNDVYLRDGGFDFSRVTGRGEASVRNAAMLLPLVQNWQLTGDQVALDLATGLANHLIGISRYFNHRGEFFGHVHSAVWAAGGLVLLGRLAGEDRYARFGRMIYEYVRGLSSSFGWVPEYAQWHPMSEEHCETCCIKDMIECGLLLAESGDGRTYDLVNRFVRNQFYEQQLKTGSFVAVDNSRQPDGPGRTYRDIDRRVVGGWSGGGEPNSISLSRFRSIAGCCVGTAPRALHMVWSRIVESRGKTVTVNLPIDRDAPEAKVETGYPNQGRMSVTCRAGGTLLLRVHPFMGGHPGLSVDGRARPPAWEGDCLRLDGLEPGAVVELSHPLHEELRRETARGLQCEVTWKGPDVVGFTPAGNPLMLYQRVAGREKEIPPPPAAGDSALRAAPTEQKK
jgi:hypothetical protein